MTDTRTSDRRVREFFASGLREERNHVRAGKTYSLLTDAQRLEYDAELIGIATLHLTEAMEAMREGLVVRSMELLLEGVRVHHCLYNDEVAVQVAQLICAADDKCVDLYNKLRSVPPSRWISRFCRCWTGPCRSAR